MTGRPDERATVDGEGTDAVRIDGSATPVRTPTTGLLSALPIGRVLVKLTVVFVLALIVVPILLTFVSSFAQSATGLVPTGFVTVEHWRLALGLGDVGARRGIGSGLWFSILLATGGMVINLIVGVPIAYALTRYEFRGREWLNTLAVLPLVPGIILGIAFLRTYPDNAGTAFGLVVGYALLKSPYMVLTVQSAFQSMDLRQLEESARSLGASWPRAFLTVIIPNAKGGIIAGSIITWTLAAAEFNFTYMVYTRGPQPFSLFLYENISRAPFLQSAAAISMYFCIVVAAISVLQLAGQRGFTAS